MTTSASTPKIRWSSNAPNGDGEYGWKTRSGGNPHPPHFQLHRFRSAAGDDGPYRSFRGNPPGSRRLFRRDPAGIKNTRFDLAWLKTSGWQSRIADYSAGGGHITGICGGYQMMGIRVHDPDGLEGEPGTTDGLDLLPVETVLQAPKTTTLSRFSWDGRPGDRL
jgi:hypothetical protein